MFMGDWKHLLLTSESVIIGENESENCFFGLRPVAHVKQKERFAVKCLHS